MKRLLFLNHNEKFFRALRDFDLFDRAVISSRETILNTLVLPDYSLLQADSLYLFSRHLGADDQYDFVDPASCFFFYDRKNQEHGFFYYSFKTRTFEKIENAHVYIYRTNWIDPNAIRWLIETAERYWLTLHIANMRIVPDALSSEKHMIYGFFADEHSRWHTLIPSGMTKVSSRMMNASLLLQFLQEKFWNTPLVIKISGTCSGKGIIFFDTPGSQWKALFETLFETAEMGNAFVVCEQIDASDTELRLHFIHEKDGTVDFVYAIEKTRHTGQRTHHYHGEQNDRECPEWRKYIPTEFEDALVEYIRLTRMPHGAIDILIARDGTPYYLETNIFSGMSNESRWRYLDRLVKYYESI